MNKRKNNIDKEIKALSKKHNGLQVHVNTLVSYGYSDAFIMSSTWSKYSHDYSLSNIQTSIDVAKTLTSIQMDAMKIGDNVPVKKHSGHNAYDRENKTY